MNQVIHGDCLDALRNLADASIDAVVTDPPAGIAFMGKAWDGNRGGRDLWVAWLAERLAECLRVLKPGGHAVVWALPRTSGWTHRALEDAGFEVRDCITHLFGTGFPKNAAVALKPSAEFWYLARRPLGGSIAENVAAHGTGALNIAACRVGLPEDKRAAGTKTYQRFDPSSPSKGVQPAPHDGLGRWPANTVVSHNGTCNGECTPGCAVAELDRQSGTLKSGDLLPGHKQGSGMTSGGVIAKSYGGDSGGASRFFPAFRYQAKPSPREKGAGLDHLPEQPGGTMDGGHIVSEGRTAPKTGVRPTRNPHPTVKPVELMRWLIRLITPPGGTVLDCFAGSGTTLVAAALEGFDSIGIEAEAEYLPVIEGRVAWAENQCEQSTLPI